MARVKNERKMTFRFRLGTAARFVATRLGRKPLISLASLQHSLLGRVNVKYTYFVCATKKSMSFFAPTSAIVIRKR